MMSHKDKNLKPNVCNDHDSEATRDILDNELDLSEAANIEDPNGISRFCNDSDAKVLQSSHYETEATLDSSYGSEVSESNSLNQKHKSTMEMQEDITEGFDRLHKLVTELLAVETSLNKIEANGKFVHGLLKQFSIHSNATKKDFLITKCDENSITEIMEPEDWKNSDISFNDKSPTFSLPGDNSHISLIPSRQSDKSTTVTATLPTGVVGIPIAEKSKSRYELIREEIIAERNAQLKAMGFFEEFSALRSEMNTKKLTKEKKKSRKSKERCERGWVRRSERIFLCSPEVLQSESSSSRLKEYSAVVKDVVEEVVSPAWQEQFFHDPPVESYQIKCEECGKGFRKKAYLKAHLVIFHKNGLNFHCQLCDYKTYRSRNLQNHMKVHPSSPYTVLKPECSKVKGDECAENSIAHRVHVKTSDSDSDSIEIFTDDSDDDDDYVPPAKQKLANVSEDDNMKQKTSTCWPCKICSKVFSSSKNLKCHEKRGHNVPVFLQCDFHDCDFGTWIKGSFTKHNTKHSSEKLKCPKCDYSTWEKRSLSGHKCLKCAECHVDFTSKYYHMKHMLLAHNIGEKFSCEYCTFSSILQGDLRKHRQNWCHPKKVVKLMEGLSPALQ